MTSDQRYYSPTIQVLKVFFSYDTALKEMHLKCSHSSPPQLLKVLICLRIKEVEVKKDTDDTAPKKKFMNYKDKKKNLSRMQRKVSSPHTCV